VHKSFFEEPTSYAAPGQHVYSTGIRVCLAKYITQTQTASIRHHVLAYAITRDQNGVVICSSMVCICLLCIYQIFTVLSSNEFETDSFAVNLLGPSHLLSMVRCFRIEVIQFTAVQGLAIELSTLCQRKENLFQRRKCKYAN
jgi:hypothetical protein